MPAGGQRNRGLAAGQARRPSQGRGPRAPGLVGWWRARREWPARSAHPKRRLARLAALVTLGWLLLAGWAPAASAMPMHWPAVPLPQLRAWLAGSPALRIPHQRGGTAAGHRHYVPASATRAGRGAGQPAGRGPGQLPPFHRRAPVFKRFRTGPGTTAGFNAATSRPVNSARSATADMYRNADGSYTKIVYPATVNYRSATGSYLPINTTLAAACHRWQETANSKSWSTIGTGPGEWWPPGWPVGEMWPFGGPGG